MYVYANKSSKKFIHAQQTSLLTSLQSAFYVMASKSTEQDTPNTSTSKWKLKDMIEFEDYINHVFL